MNTSYIKAAVIGHPVKHSKSPLIHGYWIGKYGLHGSYGAIDLAPGDLATGIRRLAEEEGYLGFNLTVPHKEAGLALCDEIDGAAAEIGAVNTLVVEEGGRIRGLNTDSYGFVANIEESGAAEGNGARFSIAGKTALVLGAGGAARAVAAGLKSRGAGRIILSNRTEAKAEALAAALGPCAVVAGWEEKEEALSGVDLLVNTTALGMTGQPPLEIGLGNLPREALVNDIVYAPLMTPILRAAQARGNPVVTGIGMLLHQARPAFAAWFGLMPEVTPELEERVLEEKVPG